MTCDVFVVLLCLDGSDFLEVIRFRVSRMALNFELLIFPWTRPFKQERTGIGNPSSKEGTVKW